MKKDLIINKLEGMGYKPEIDKDGDGEGMFQKRAVDAEVVEDTGKENHRHQNHQHFRRKRQSQMDVLAADYDGERRAERDEVHGPVRMEKNDI